MGHEIHIPTGGPPRVEPPSREIYARMGEANIYRMMADVYAAFGQSSIRHLFPRDLARASEKSAAYFVGLFGGPPLYHQRYGPPRLRARHLPFTIDEAGRQEWLRCFNQVLDEAVEKYAFPAEHLPGLRTFLHEFSGWMVNRAMPEADEERKS